MINTRDSERAGEFPVNTGCPVQVRVRHVGKEGIHVDVEFVRGLVGNVLDKVLVIHSCGVVCNVFLLENASMIKEQE